jgi:predicted nucleotidyltransferase
MIVNESVIEREKTAQEDILDIIRASRIPFYLTGSRFFGNYKPESDWDFFTETSQDVSNFLIKYGFELEAVSYNGDTEIVNIWYHSEVNIHIQVVKDVAIKVEAQRILTRPMLKNLLIHLNNEERKLMWADAYYIVKYGLANFKRV